MLLGLLAILVAIALGPARASLEIVAYSDQLLLFADPDDVDGDRKLAYRFALPASINLPNPPRPPCPRWQSRARELGGHDAYTTVELTLSNPSPSEIVVDRLRIKDISSPCGRDGTFTHVQRRVVSISIGTRSRCTSAIRWRRRNGSIIRTEWPTNSHRSGAA